MLLRATASIVGRLDQLGSKTWYSQQKDLGGRRTA
jgi:hypothetical protein